MSIVIMIFIVVLTTLGLRTTYTDIKWHKTFNKDLKVFLVCGIMFQTVYFIVNGTRDLVPFLINFGITLLLSYMFYVFHLWAAGDAKLFSLIALLIPYELYNVSIYQIFPMFYVLSFIFLAALIYIVIESMILFVKEIADNNHPLHWQKPKFKIDIIIEWLMGYSIVILLNNCLLASESMLIYSNSYILIFVNVLAVTAALTAVEKTRYRVAVLILAITARVAMMIFNGQFESLISFHAIFVVSCMIFVRKFTSRYNYRMIPTQNVCQGMILARVSIIDMLPSKVHDLPKFTDETTRSRLTEEEADAIKRWESSKYGKPQIIIARHIPLAPFIFVGTMFFIIVKMVAGDF